MGSVNVCLLDGPQFLHLQNGDILGPQQCTDQIKDFFLENGTPGT